MSQRRFAIQQVRRPTAWAAGPGGRSTMSCSHSVRHGAVDEPIMTRFEARHAQEMTTAGESTPHFCVESEGGQWQKIAHLLDFLVDGLTVYLDEKQQFLYDKYELEALIATICGTLKRAKWLRKAAQARATEQDS
jgi:hypothetical protein